ncbi:MAG: hypothetical protein CSA84_07465 [Actinomycetales bacterium]|nr:MAG: hypothetical protein CSA84_07465 [Actinomycetales bacterium]
MTGSLAIRAGIIGCLAMTALISLLVLLAPSLQDDRTLLLAVLATEFLLLVVSAALFAARGPSIATIVVFIGATMASGISIGVQNEHVARPLMFITAALEVVVLTGMVMVRADRPPGDRRSTM